jgi:hypothetical protein
LATLALDRLIIQPCIQTISSLMLRAVGHYLEQSQAPASLEKSFIKDRNRLTKSELCGIHAGFSSWIMSVGRTAGISAGDAATVAGHRGGANEKRRLCDPGDGMRATRRQHNHEAACVGSF